VCKSLIEAMGGSLAIESELLRGTSVTVTLPSAPQGKALRRKPKKPECRSGLEASLKILIVDDDPLVRRSLARVLRKHSITSVGSGREAVELVGSGHNFDVILCDVMMPELTGVDVYERIAELDERAARRIVFLTGGAFSQATATRLERLPNARFEKPLDDERLHQALRAASAPPQ
jgi:two-component system, NtrC family, sensor kinase